MSTAINTDLSYANGIPGVYVKIDLSGSGATADDTLKRLNILACKTSSGTLGPDTPTLCTSQTLANQYAGQGSDAARLYAAAVSEVGPGNLDVYLTCVSEPSGGTASRYQLVGSFSSGSSAAAAGVVNIWLAGYRVSVGIASGDSLTTIIAGIKSAIDLLLDIPVTAALATAATSNDTVNLTYRHKGVHGEDFPIRVQIDGSSNFQLAAGYDTSATLVFATSSSGAGSVILNVGETTITASLSGITTAANIAVAITAAVNAGSYPVTASNPSGALVNLYYASGRDVRRISCKVVDGSGSGNGTTVNGVTAGTLTDVGTATSNTPGAGAPTLTTALTNIGAQSAFGAWVTPFTDATSMGAIATHIEAQFDGVRQKDQVPFIASALSLATAGAVPSSSSPALTATPNYCMVWQAGAAVQASEQAARVAAYYLGGSSYVAQNFDGVKVVSKSSTVPLLAPHVNVRPGIDDQNAAVMTYHLTPIVVDGNGNQVVLRGMTTSASSNMDLRELPVRKQLAYGRIQLRTRLTNLFQGKNFKASGDPKTPNTFTTDSVKTAIFELLQQLDNQDLFDGAQAVKSSISVAQDGTVRTRINVFVPWAVIRAIHQIGVVLSPQ